MHPSPSLTGVSLRGRARLPRTSHIGSGARCRKLVHRMRATGCGMRSARTDAQVGRERAGRLPSWGADALAEGCDGDDYWAQEAGIVNGGTSAEEAAVHVVPAPERTPKRPPAPSTGQGAGASPNGTPRGGEPGEDSRPSQCNQSVGCASVRPGASAADALRRTGPTAVVGPRMSKQLRQALGRSDSLLHPDKRGG
ncbi:DUF5709 domain-containing protein [Streptomyces sp. NPDC101149]|uniref:DUF5709 domain-containing protein n=1 Tax=Streptomyces sp. NPDC101149 TaxID=3366113 RepID=UPI00380440F6